jgi:hypothetical protein
MFALLLLSLLLAPHLAEIGAEILAINYLNIGFECVTPSLNSKVRAGGE